MLKKLEVGQVITLTDKIPNIAIGLLKQFGSTFKAGQKFEVAVIDDSTNVLFGSDYLYLKILVDDVWVKNPSNGTGYFSIFLMDLEGKYKVEDKVADKVEGKTWEELHELDSFKDILDQVSIEKKAAIVLVNTMNIDTFFLVESGFCVDDMIKLKEKLSSTSKVAEYLEEKIGGDTLLDAVSTFCAITDK